ncbi:hypothetical protein K439DRAFT_1612089 [Ramaria rubella]|nr:hypothetical protein K439DRAFT_1612089 [Ramaria rubella]
MSTIIRDTSERVRVKQDYSLRVVELNSRLRANYAQFAVSAVALYILDYSFILPREIALIWKNQMKLGSVLYLVARFNACFHTRSKYPYLHEGRQCYYFFQSSTCVGVVRVAGATFLVSQLSTLIVLEAILIIRAYAISNQNRHVLVALTSLAIGTNIPGFMYIANLKCDASIQKAQNIEFILLNALVVFFDSALIVVTLYYTLGLRRLQVGMRFDKMSLTSLLIQQGLVHFLVSLGVAVALMVPNQVLPPRFNNVLGYHTLIIQNSIQSRFFLDLRWFSAHPNGTTFTKAMAQQSSQSQHQVAGSTFQDAAHSQWSFDSVVVSLPHNATRRTLDLESLEGFEGLYRMRRWNRIKPSNPGALDMHIFLLRSTPHPLFNLRPKSNSLLLIPRPPISPLPLPNLFQHTLRDVRCGVDIPKGLDEGAKGVHEVEIDAVVYEVVFSHRRGGGRERDVIGLDTIWNDTACKI